MDSVREGCHQILSSAQLGCPVWVCQRVDNHNYNYNYNNYHYHNNNYHNDYYYHNPSSPLASQTVQM